jgi:hypothetical protein
VKWRTRCLPEVSAALDVSAALEVLVFNDKDRAMASMFDDKDRSTERTQKRESNEIAKRSGDSALWVFVIYTCAVVGFGDNDHHDPRKEAKVSDMNASRCPSLPCRWLDRRHGLPYLRE